MRKISEVLRLRFELGFGYRQIAQSCLIGVGTVHEYLKRAEAAGVQWPLPDGMTETLLGNTSSTSDSSTATSLSWLTRTR